MGCDMRAMMERRNKEQDAAWLGQWFGAGELDIQRDYELFRVLAGVRDDFPAPPISAKPRGMPKDASSAFRGFARQMGKELPGALHSHSWVTLAELLAYDLDQEFFDPSLVIERDADGNIVNTTNSANTSMADSGPVGMRKVFSLPTSRHWGREQWDMIIRELKHVKEHWGLTSDEDVRLSFFFYA